jgi:hypothetical protein
MIVGKLVERASESLLATLVALPQPKLGTDC